MDLSVPWDAPETVVDVSSAGVVPLPDGMRDLPDGMGLVGRQKDATESRILQGRDPRSIRVLVPDRRGFDQSFHDVTIVDMGNLPESHVSRPELAELIHRWPPAVINHMTWRQREIELMRKNARITFRQKHLTPCTFCSPPFGVGPAMAMPRVMVHGVEGRTSRLEGPYTGRSQCARGNQKSQLRNAFPSMDSHTTTVYRVPVGSTFGHFE